MSRFALVLGGGSCALVALAAPALASGAPSPEAPAVEVPAPPPTGEGAPAPGDTTGSPPPDGAAATPYPAAPLPPPPPPPPPEELRVYGDKGTPELALGFGYSSSSGFLAAGGFRYFVVDAVAPGIEATYVSGGRGGAAYGLLLGALRVVAVRSPSFALVVTGRGGRVFLGDHDDAWGVGGGAGMIFMVRRGTGLEIGYELLRLLPSSVCADLGGCVIQGPVVGLRLVL